MHTCIVCTNSSPRTKDKPYVTYHSIPSNPKRRKKWLRSLKIKNILDWHRVCSYHFTDDDYILQRGFKRTLRKSAIPSSEIVVNQDSNTKPELIARLRRSLTVMSELVYPEDPKNSRNRRHLKETIRRSNQIFENMEAQRVESNSEAYSVEQIFGNTEAYAVDQIFGNTEAYAVEQTVENTEVHAVEQTVENTEVHAVEQTVENTELHTVEQRVENNEVQTVEQSVEITEIQTNTEVTTANQTVNKAEITPRRSTRKIKVKKNDDEIESNSLALSRRKIFTQNNSGDQTISTTGNQKPKNYYRMGQGIKCYVKTCTNRYSKSGLSFFGFPNDADIREHWIKNCGLSPGEIKPLGKLKSTIRICRNHFEDTMFLNPNKPKRLKPDAVPTIFNNDDQDVTSESTHSNHENFNVVTNPYAIYNGMESQINTADHAPDDMNNVSITNDNVGVNNLHNYCSIPGCNINEYTKDIGSETLYRPDNKSMANNWSRVYGVKLTENSAVCSRHFGATDTNDSEIALDRSYTSKTLKTYKSASKRSKTNNDTDDLTIKKSKNNSFSDESKSTANYENEDLEYINNSTLLSNRKLNDSFINTPVISSDAHASFDNVLTKTTDNNFAPMSMKGKCTIEYYSGAGTPIIIHSPEDDENDLAPSNVPSDDSIPISLQSQFKKIISKSRPNDHVTNNFGKNFCPKRKPLFKLVPNDPSIDHSLFGDLAPSIIGCEQVSSIDSTKTINVEESYNSVIVKPEPFDEFIPTTSTDDVMSDSCESNFYKTPPLTSIEDSMLRTQESNFQTTTEQTPMTDLGIYVKPEPIDVMDDEDENTLTEDNLQSNAESPHSTSISNSISKILQKKLDELQKDVSESRNSTPTSSKLKQILLNTPSNSSLSITVHPGHQRNNSNASNTSLSNYHQKSQQSAVNSEVSGQSCARPSIALVEFINKSGSTIKPTLPNEKRLASNNQSLIPPVILNYVSPNPKKNGTSQNKKKEFNQGNLLIHEIAKTTKLPTNLWRHYFNIRSNSTRFIEFAENMEPIKKVTFNKSLVPDIFINGKSFEFCEEIRTADQLENLLVKVDEIEVCLGYGGLHHDQCIAYFDDTSEETLLCHNCKVLMAGNSMRSEDVIVQCKSNLIKELHNQIFEMETIILQTKKKKYIQRQKKDDLENILQVINPFKVLKTLKPPTYIN